MLRPIALCLVSIAVAASLVVSLIITSPEPLSQGADRQQTESNSLVIACAASNRAVMEKIAKDYQEKYGVPIEFQFGPSQMLLSSIEVGAGADLFLPADSSYLVAGQEKGLICEAYPVATMRVVLGVGKGNPLKIKSFPDLLRRDVRLVQANPEIAAVGQLTEQTLCKQGKWEELKAHTAAFVSTVTEAASSVQVGASDVAIVYDAILSTYPDLVPIEIDEFQDCFAEVGIGLTTTCQQPERAQHFLDFLTSWEGGLHRYAESGFTPVSEKSSNRENSP